MRFQFLLLLILAHLGISIANAGPWLREEGTGFAAISLGSNRHKDIVGTAYLEYGATAQTTVGVDIGLHDKISKGRKAYGTLFLRRGIGAPERQHKLAYELGIGAVYTDEELTPHLKTTLTWGKGIKLRETAGWMTVEGAVIWPLDGTDPIAKLDSTLGLNFTKMTSGIVQLNLAQQDSELTGYLEHSLVITPRHNKFRVKFGTETPLGDFDATSLKLGVWHEF